MAKAKYTWEVEWSDGTVTNVGGARGPRDAQRKAMQQERRLDVRAIRSKTTGSPFLYRLVSWRPR